MKKFIGAILVALPLTIACAGGVCASGELTMGVDNFNNYSEFYTSAENLAENIYTETKQVFEANVGWTTSVTGSNLTKAKTEKTTATFEKDPKDDTNGTLMLRRETTGTESGNINLDVKKDLKTEHETANGTVDITALTEGTVNVEMKIYFTNSSFRLKVGNIIQDIRHDRIQPVNGTAVKYQDLDDTYKPDMSSETWHTLKYSINLNNKKVKVLWDGKQIISQVISAIPDLSNISIRMDRGGYTGEVYLDDFNVFYAPPSETVDFENFTDEGQYSVTKNLKLILNDESYTYTYTSSDESILKIEAPIGESNTTVGTIIRAPFADKKVNLTIVVKEIGETEVFDEKEVAIIVKAKGDKPYLFEEDFGAVTEDTPLSESDENARYNKWLLNADTYQTSKDIGNTITRIDGASDGTVLELKLSTKYNGSNGVPHLRPFRKLDEAITGTVIASFRFKPKTQYYTITFNPFATITSSKSGSVPYTKYETDALTASKFTKQVNNDTRIKTDEWNTAAFIVDFDLKQMHWYVNGEVVKEKIPITASSVEEIGIYMPRNGSVGTVLVDDIVFKRSGASAEEELLFAKEILELNYDDSSDEIDFLKKGAFGTEISWESLNTDIISNDGEINRPLETDVNVDLVATVSKEGKSETKTFTVTVNGITKAESLSKQFTVDDILNGQSAGMVTENIFLPPTFTAESGEVLNIVWHSDNTAITTDGVVTRGDYNTKATLTANISLTSDSANTATKKFILTVPGKGNIIFFEDFNDLQVGDIATSRTEGQDGWRSSENSLTKANNDKDVSTDSGTALKVFVDKYGNKVLQSVRSRQAKFDSDGVVIKDENGKDIYINLKASKAHTTAQGLISFSYRIKGTGNENMVMPLTSNLKTNSIQFINGSTVSFGEKKIYDGSWHEIKYLMDYHRKTVKFYIDDVQIGGTVSLTAIPDIYGNLTIGMQRASMGEVLIDDILICELHKGAEDDIAEISSTFANDYIPDRESLREGLYMPAFGKYNTRIEYSVDSASTNPTAITITNGKIDINRLVGVSQTVILNAKFSRGAEDVYTYTLPIEITVPASTQAEFDTDAFGFENFSNTDGTTNQNSTYITDSLDLVNSYNGYAISWTSSSPIVNTNTGFVQRGDYDVPVTLTAAFTGIGGTATKTFDIIVAANGSVLPSNDFIDSDAWKTETVYQKDDVKYQEKTDIFDSARNVLEVERNLTIDEAKADGDSVSGLKYYQVLPNIKYDRIALDFDLMLRSRESVASFKLYNTDGRNINKLFEISENYIMQKMFDSRKINFTEPLIPDRWHHFSLVFNVSDDEVVIFKDYEQIGAFSVEGMKATVNAIAFYSDVSSKVRDIFRLDNLMIRQLGVSDDKAVEIAKNQLAVNTVITGNDDVIILPEKGAYDTKIFWSSSNENVVTDDGIVTHSVLAEGNAKLTAAIVKGNASTEKEFDVTVPQLAAYADINAVKTLIEDQLTFNLVSDEAPYALTDDINLIEEYNKGAASRAGGITVDWISSVPQVVSENGKVVPQKYNVSVTLTATIKYNGNAVGTKEFRVIVLKKASSPLREYTFEEITDAHIGEALYTYTDITSKKAASGTEYGMQYFADAVPQAYEGNTSKNAIYMHRYFRNKNSDESFALSDSYMRIQADQYEFKEISGSTCVSFRFLLENDADLQFMLRGIMDNRIYIKKDSIEVKGVDTYSLTTNLADNKWYGLEFFFDLASKRMDIYLDGVKLNTTSVPTPAAKGYIDSITFWNSNDEGNVGNIFIDDIAVCALLDYDKEAIAADAASLNLSNSYTNNVSLPLSGENGSRIKWISSNRDVVTDNGKVLKSGNVIMTAHIMKGKYIETKAFNINVLAQPAAVDITALDRTGNNITVTLSSSAPAGTTCFIEFYNKGQIEKISAKSCGSVSDISASYSEVCDEIAVYVRDNSGNIISNILRRYFN